MVNIGDRIRILYCSDPFTRIPFGTEGVVRFVDDLGTIHVDWDNGSQLGVIPGIDRFELVGFAGSMTTIC